ncbi:hypothetical protein K3G39_16855 [Pontibacter sp. HSC-14F20]|uniref:hypothetical protein n=1 Tax=Pontibacter sp. HSC-14F20 TaxID=2864136 RepID=UPI001C73055E|nr:hypothetical protein [Pontibacter sp. HSC-14F20]MBX0334909.1 hypothetical protein [Pontibacter sp. HSC-14F20]
MSTRILHCSTSVENYNICIQQNVAGFSHKGPQQNDLIYLAVKVGKKTLCGARFKLDQVTNHKPWPDSERYVHTLSVKEVEFCYPFDIGILSEAGGKHWSIKYVQSSKPITDQAARDLLDREFQTNKTEHFIPFEVTPIEVAPPIPVKTLEPVPAPAYQVLDEAPLMRDSIRIQAMLADIGDRMGYSIWLPRNDRSRVLEIWQTKKSSVLNDLPLNYDLDTIRTIENIDVLWIKGRTIVRAYEVEHTTSIYYGILRMADLMALQPNLNINAHIVAPEERRGKVMQELSRPVFRLLLAHSCSFISYNAVEDLAKEKRLKFMTDAVIEDISESAKETLVF